MATITKGLLFACLVGLAVLCVTAPVQRSDAAATSTNTAAATPASILPKDSVKTGQYAQTFDTHDESLPQYNCLIYIPEDYAKSKGPWPLVVFLHGAGETGTDIEKVKVHGPPKLIVAGKTFPAIIVSPQSPPRAAAAAKAPAAATPTVAATSTAAAAATATATAAAPAATSTGSAAAAPAKSAGRGARGGWQPKPLEGLIDEIQKKYDVDPKRIYVTGLSMGGMGTWALAIDQPDRFAALAPMAARGDATEVAVLKDVPIWVFHGAKDPTVPIKGDQDMVDALKAAGSNVKFTIYPDVQHDSWTASYANPDFWKWLFDQRKK